MNAWLTQFVELTANCIIDKALPKTLWILCVSTWTGKEIGGTYWLTIWEKIYCVLLKINTVLFGELFVGYDGTHSTIKTALEWTSSHRAQWRWSIYTQGKEIKNKDHYSDWHGFTSNNWNWNVFEVSSCGRKETRVSEDFASLLLLLWCRLAQARSRTLDLTKLLFSEEGLRNDIWVKENWASLACHCCKMATVRSKVQDKISREIWVVKTWFSWGKCQRKWQDR